MMVFKGYGFYKFEVMDCEKEEFERVFGVVIIKMKVGWNIIWLLLFVEGVDFLFCMMWMYFVMIVG